MRLVCAFVAILCLTAPISALAQKFAPSFDCSKARQPDETAVCGDAELSQLDRIANTAFKQLRARRSSNPSVIISLAREFQNKRKQCSGDVECIRHSYVDLIKSFQEQGAAVQMPPSVSDQHPAGKEVLGPDTQLNEAPLPPPVPALETTAASEAVPHATLSSDTPSVVVSWLTVGLVSCVIILTIMRRVRSRAIANGIIDDYMNSQAALFARKRSQLIFVDDYEIERTKNREKEKKYIASIVIPQHLRGIPLPGRAIKYIVHIVQDQIGLIRKIEAAALSIAAPQADEEASGRDGGIEYEKRCAELLRGVGWNARLTPGSGDQGVDIVAEGFGKRVVLQCKLYSKPVGNKAVQEIIAARMYEQADVAVVVSNANYTTSARRLAAKAGVLLMHHDELKMLHEKMNSLSSNQNSN
jgi:restriction system protein